MNNIFEKDREYIASTYARFPVEIVSGKGSVVYGRDGKSYIDMGSGIGVTSFGISDDEWVAAVTRQLTILQHTSNLYYTEPCVLLAEQLCKKSGMKKVFFANSGAEANECAIKAARKYASEKKGSDAYTVISLKNSFHGRTLTTLAATGQDHYHELYNPLTPGFESIEAENFEALEALSSRNDVAAIIIECIQGEGGVIALSEKYVKAVYEYASENDVVLIVDEVQTGNGRTGELYAYMNYGILPDVVTTAKGLGGGLPIGAAMLGEKVKDVFEFGDHGSTYGGNPVACAGALNIINRIDGALLEDVKRKGELVKKSLEGAKGIISVSGMGLMIGIETESAAKDVVNKAIEKGVLCLTAKNKVRLLPALNISDELLMNAVEIIKEICAE